MDLKGKIVFHHRSQRRHWRGHGSCVCGRGGAAAAGGAARRQTGGSGLELRWNAAPPAVHSIDLDVRDRSRVQRTIDELPEEWAEIDVLVNNAGLSRGLDKLYTGKIEDWEEMIDTNVKGLLYVTRAVVPGMVVRGRGHVVNLGSTAGELAYPNGAVYCGSKAAERLINDGLRQDVLGTPVRVTSVDPGMVETDFSLVRFRGDQERAAKVYKGVTPLTAGRCGRSDCVGDQAAGACEHCAGVHDHDPPGEFDSLSPGRLGVQWFPPLRQKEVARMGHGAFVPRQESPFSTEGRSQWFLFSSAHYAAFWSSCS